MGPICSPFVRSYVLTIRSIALIKRKNPNSYSKRNFLSEKFVEKAKSQKINRNKNMNRFHIKLEYFMDDFRLDNWSVFGLKLFFYNILSMRLRHSLRPRNVVNIRSKASLMPWLTDMSAVISSFLVSYFTFGVIFKYKD